MDHDGYSLFHVIIQLRLFSVENYVEIIDVRIRIMKFEHSGSLQLERFWKKVMVLIASYSSDNFYIWLNKITFEQTSSSN